MAEFKHITLFDRQYPADKQAEGIIISQAIATVICCDRCSFEFQVDGNYQRRTMNRIAKKQGWRIGKEDICPFCIEREKRKEDDKQ